MNEGRVAGQPGVTPLTSLDCFFRPRAIAVIGASERLGSVGRQVFENLLGAGFKGRLHAVNLRHDAVLGQPAVASVCDVKDDVDLAVVATPAATVPEVLEACARKGVKGALILSAGFAEAGVEGRRLQQRLVEIARHRRMRVVGPNCLGVICTASGLNATFSRGAALAGGLALVSQSGALCTAILDWALPRKIGFSSVVSLGDAADVDFGELLDVLALDPHTRSILLYIEGIRDARRFVSGLRAAARIKPVVVLKSGRHGPGMRAAISHTGALASADDAFDAAIERAGAVRVSSIGQLFALAQMLGEGARIHGNRLAVVGNAGGPGVMAADRAADLGVELASLSDATRAELDRLLPAQWSHGNPVDILGDATPERYGQALDAVFSDPNVDAVLAILTPQAMTAPLKAAEAALASARGPNNSRRKVLVTCWMGGQQVQPARALFEAERAVQFHTPEAAVEAFHYLAEYERNQRLLLEVPGPLGTRSNSDVRGAELIIEGALAEQRTTLNAPEVRALLHAFGIPIAPSILVHSAEEALVAAETLGFPVALKIDSPDIVHTSDVGGVVLDVADAGAVRGHYHRLLTRVAELRSDLRIHGVLVEAMCHKPYGRELVVGAFQDPVFGPVLSFGSGGVALEVLRDRGVALPPLNRLLAKRLIDKTRVAALLGSFRHLPPVARDQVEDVLLAVSEMVCELPHLTEFEINPLIADAHGVVAVDARVSIRRPQLGHARYRHLAIHPYPAELTSSLQLPDGTNITLRPIRPEDATIEAEFVKGLSDEAKYMRFMTALQELSPQMLARLTQIDYDREMAFVATLKQDDGEAEIGVARYYTNPDGESCEFALVVADAWQKRGIGSKLMDRLILVASDRGLRTMSGVVLARNVSMLALLKDLGFSASSLAEPDRVEVTKALR